MVVVPPLTPVTASVALLELPANCTVAGTVATVGSSDFKLTVRPPAGAGDARVSATFTVLVPLTTIGDGK